MRYVSLLTFFALSCAVAPYATDKDSGTYEERLCDLYSCGLDEWCAVLEGRAVCVPVRPYAAPCALACPSGSECFYDVCIPSNTAGAVCEFAEDCAAYELCVLGRCSDAICSPGTVTECYTGAAGTRGVGMCHGGFRMCTSHGVFDTVCIGEVTPLEETGLVACNGLDDDCDGTVDVQTVGRLNLIFAFDVSGSMIEEFPHVVNALRETAEAYIATSVQLGLIVFPGSRVGFDKRLPYEIIELTDYISFLLHLEILEGLLQALSATSGGSQECSWDIPQAIVDGFVVQRPGAAALYDPDVMTAIVMFTDEPGQSYLDEENDEDSMCALIETSGVRLYTLTTPGSAHDFDNCGEVFELLFDSHVMASQLTDIATAVCDSL